MVLGREEAPAHQGRAAAFAGEAVVVPLALLKRDVLAAAQTWGQSRGRVSQGPAVRGAQLDLTADGAAAGNALLGKQLAEAAEAVDKVVPGREALAGQLGLAAGADEALLVPGLLPVVHASCGDGLDKGSGLQVRTGTGAQGRRGPVCPLTSLQEQHLCACCFS